MDGVVISAPTSYIGATALAVSPESYREELWVPAAQIHAEQPPLYDPPPPPPTQPAVGRVKKSQGNLIPFESLQRPSAARAPVADTRPPAYAAIQKPPSVAAAPPPAAPASRPQAKRQVSSAQGSLDFRPGSSQSERMLATGVPAQVSGDGHVAPPMRRVAAGAMDVSMVLLGFSLFAVVGRFAGPAFGADLATSFGSGKAMWVTLALAMILISLFYGLIWAMARRETAGMNWTQLQLVTFDGSRPDGRDRAIRFVAAWLSYCSGGLGLLWALADEESLAFHDHISKTYPAEKGSAGTITPRRR